MSDKEKSMLVSEVNILRELNHPHIVRYYDRVIDRDHSKIFIVMEYCEGGDISTLIRASRKEKKHIPEDMIWTIAYQILLAL
jgi:NIMA (never in mitosis gene a)-related kinase